jgi:hypothetical protein
MGAKRASERARVSAMAGIIGARRLALKLAARP